VTITEDVATAWARYATDQINSYAQLMSMEPAMAMDDFNLVIRFAQRTAMDVRASWELFRRLRTSGSDAEAAMKVLEDRARFTATFGGS
jgi:hypothetical protein